MTASDVDTPDTAFRGSLQSIDLPSLVRFFSTIQASGCLRVRCGRWTGEVGCDRGQVVAASFGAERGLAALDAVLAAVAQGDFTFSAGPPPAERNLDPPPSRGLC